MTSTTNRSGNGWARWVAIGLTVAIAVLAITVQWGVVTTKLDHVEKRLDELIVEARALRSEYQSIERRVSYLEGRASSNPRSGSTSGGGTPGP